MKLGDLSVTYVEVLGRTLNALGGDSAALFADYGISAETLSSPDARISIPRYMRIGHDAIQRCHNPALGLEMGLHMQASHFGKAGLLALTSADVRQACQVLTQYEVLSSYNSRGASSFRVSHGEGQLNFYSISPYNEFNLFVVDMALSSWYQLLIRLTGRKDLVAAVDIEFPEPDYADLYRRYFPCKVRFGAPSNTLVLHSGALAVPVVQHCASVHEKLRREADQELARVQKGLSYRDQVAGTISPLLNGEAPRLETVARRLNTTPWSLRRRLQAEGVNFQQLLDQTRRELGEAYVRDTALTLGEIAYLLGFGSVGAFQRAFRRWTGEAPGQYRIRHRTDQGREGIPAHISTASSPSSS